jgi:WASH complex subunit 7, N-terminal
MATELKKCIKSLILMHQKCGRQISKARLHDIVRGIEMLKAIEVEFRQKRF